MYTNQRSSNAREVQSSQRSDPRIPSNEIQDEVGLAAKEGKRLQEFFDLLTGVVNYSPSNLDRQGVIRIWFAKDLIKHQFIIDFKDIIQEFLKAAIEELPNAVPRGTLIKTQSGWRKTERNIISRCQYIARMKTRAYINSIYRDTITMSCPICGKIKKITNKRICKNCDVEMDTQHIHANVDDVEPIDRQFNQYEIFSLRQCTYQYEHLVKEVRQLFEENSRSQQIFDILLNPQSSLDMCGRCENRSRTRIIGRKSLNVINERVLYKCDAQAYDPISCTNTSKNIAAYLGVSKSLVDSKIRLIRKRFTRYIMQNIRHNDFCDELAVALGEMVSAKHES